MYAVWLLPSSEDRKILEKIISELAERYDSPKFIPHITTYGLIDIDLEKLKRFVDNSIKNISSFDVPTKNLAYTDNIWKTLFINIQMNSNLENIFQNLQKQLGSVSHYEYLPHVSLIYKIMPEAEKKFLLNQIKIPNKLSINKIAIQEFSHDITKWKLVKEMHL